MKHTGIAIVLFCTAAGGVFAQSYQGGVRGTVSDGQGAAISGAKVSLVNEASSVTRSTLTNNGGEYVFNAVDPAAYSVVCESPGFKKFERKKVMVATQEFLTVDAKLELGAVSDSVLVTEEVPLLETANASNGQVLDIQKMTDLPNLGRNPFLLSKLSASVVTAGDPRFNRFQDQSGSSQISIGPVAIEQAVRNSTRGGINKDRPSVAGTGILRKRRVGDRTR